MNYKNKKYPFLRFKNFNDEWEQCKLGEHTKLITKGTTPKDKTGRGTINFIKVENITNGEILPIQKITDEEHNNYLKRSRLKENDILFSIAGTLGRTAIVKNEVLPANTNQALAIIREYKFDKYFLIASLTGNVVADYIRKNPTVGAQPNLSLEQVSNLIISTPILKEQSKIGSLFYSLDHLITLHQSKLENLEQTKKGLLQKLFPKINKVIPKIRFNSFFDNWLKFKLAELSNITIGEFVIKSKQNTPSSIYSVYNGGVSYTGKYELYNNEGPKIIISARGANAGFINLIKTRYWRL